MTDIDRQPNQNPAKQVFLAYAFVGVAGAAFSLTVPRPDRHPMIFAFALSWLIMSLVGGFMGKILLRLDPKQFRFARWERDGQMYERFGLGVFRWLLLHFPLSWLNPQIKLRSGRSDIDRLLRELNVAEAAHAIAAGVSLAVAAAYGVGGHTTVGIWMVLITIPLNVYPVMVQRWNRGRIWRLQRRIAGLHKRT